MANDVELVCDQLGVRQDGQKDTAVGGGEIERARAHRRKPVLTAREQPRLGFITLAVGHEVQELTLVHIDECGHEVRCSALAGLHEQVLVKTQGAHVAEAVGVVHERFAEQDHRVVDRVPITSERRGDLSDGAPVGADLKGGPARRPVSQSQS